jgi:trehalose-6-phosphate synthase
MLPDEKRARMQRMRALVQEHNVYRWAGSLIGELAGIRLETVEPATTSGSHLRADYAETVVG